MEYIFGTDDYTGSQILKTKGDVHTDLTGFCETVREYTDTTITDSFYVVEKTQSKEDAEDNCYDWYVIDKHNQTIDRTKELKQHLDEMIVAALEG